MYIQKRKVVFTNGCFYLITARHIGLIQKIRKYFPEKEYKLIVGVNSNFSVYNLKGYPEIMTHEQRKLIIENIKGVDSVVMFNDNTPENIINVIKPDIIVKGFDYIDDEIVGSDIVRDMVITIKLDEDIYNINTKDIIDTIRKLGD